MQGEGGRRKGDDKKATGKDSRVGGLHYNLGGGITGRQGSKKACSKSGEGEYISGSVA